MSDRAFLRDKERCHVSDAKTLEWFLFRCLEKLRRNSKKAHWREAKQDYLLQRIREETNELMIALMEEPENVIAECADVANFAMMIADNHREKMKEEV